ncbi:T9SS type A sorting domain-containing protein [candidate division KSB1 bacterium]|nr:T9SS type A sorting domain-containing protein [candidate division KSB1 bacterium]
MRKYANHILIFLIMPIAVLANDFEVEPLITVPGNNRNFSVASYGFWSWDYEQKNYICWENQVDSSFTIFVKQIWPLQDTTLIVYSSYEQNTNPVIAYDFYGGFRVVWQSFRNGKWRLLCREWKNEHFSEIAILTDTLSNSIQPTLSSSSLAWIQDGKLMCLRGMTDLWSIDSVQCSHPNMFWGDGWDPSIVYEKGDSAQKQIFYTRYIGQVRQNPPYWEIHQLTEDGHNLAPRFGVEYDIAYQTLVDNIWKANYYWNFRPDDQGRQTENRYCNFEHPVFFSYPIFTAKLTAFSSGYFLVVDSDSLGDRDVFLVDWDGNFIENISNSRGNDIKPIVVYCYTGDYYDKLTLIWEHYENGKSDIWWGLTDYYRIRGDVATNNLNIPNFVLHPNYPNPFNSSTIIRYELNQTAHVRVEIYNPGGQLIAQLVDQNQEKGTHAVRWNPANISSGLYFYILWVEGSQTIRKCLYVK